ncbi:MAG TPA: alpha/beta fold hydrolase [candidate division Zixibacteria bacterium]|nr:alpha/beta fold hydrolase [candidate division Zixibacteria bacterium]
MPLAALKDAEIYYEEHGAGEPVLLVPPSWWPCDTWKVGVVPALSRRYRAVIFDCRGAGRSSAPEDGYTVDQFARDAVALLARLDISRCHVVGFALGGQIAQAMALLRPALVASLVIAAAGSGSRSVSGTARPASRDEASEIRERGFERFIRGHVENDHMAFGPRFFREHPETVKALSDALWERQGSPELFARHAAARRTWDTLANASRLAVPTLVLCGAEDHVDRGGSTPADTARRLGETIPGAELALLPGVKHMTFWDGTRALEILQDFLARHPI